MPQAFAVIPARGGSKGVPGKNLARIGGLPLVVRAIRAASAVSALDRVVVSTDDGRISDVARAAGADVVQRPEDLASDTATSESALLHAVGELGLEDDDVLVFLQCTSPFTAPEDIAATLELVASAAADSAFTATPFKGFLWAEGDEGWTGVNHPGGERARRQDRPVELLETGAVYAMRVGGLRRASYRFHGTVLPHVVPADRSIEIDEPGDLELARRMAPLFAERPDFGRVHGVVLDFDGVLTDNRALTMEDGTEGVLVHRGDGWGIARLLDDGVAVTVLSTEENPVVAARCRKLRLPVQQGLGGDKLTALRSWLKDTAIEPDDVVYVGNDVNDLAAMAEVGLPVAVADAAPEVLATVRWTLTRPGGAGAVRELCDLIIRDRRTERSRG